MNNRQSKNKMLRIPCKQGGFALATMLCAVIILIILGTALLSIGLHSRGLAVRTSSEISARCAADAGMTKAFFEMNEKLKVIPWDDSSLPQVTNETLLNSEAVYSYAVTGELSSGYTIESTGISGLQERTVQCSLPLQGLFEYAIFGDESVELKNNATITWFNFDADDRNLQIGTNSTLADSVILMNGATINGDVVVGVGGDPDTIINYTWATITGNTYAMTKEYKLPDIIVPEELAALPSGGILNDSTILSSSAKYDGINLGNNKIVVIDGEVKLYIIGDIILKNSAELQVLNGEDASLTLYVGGDIEVKNSGVINNLSADAKKLRMYGLDSCNSIDLKNSSNFYGAIYAPQADVVMMNSADVFGAIVAKSFEQKNAATFNYDASLRDTSIDDEGIRFVITKWQEE